MIRIRYAGAQAIPVENSKSKYRKRPADRNKPKEFNPNYKIRNWSVWNIASSVLVIWICFGSRSLGIAQDMVSNL